MIYHDRLTLRRPTKPDPEHPQFIALVSGQQFGIVVHEDEDLWVCYGLVPSEVLGRARTLFELFDAMEEYLGPAVTAPAATAGGLCPGCDRTVEVVNGLLIRHRGMPKGTGECSGSGHRPLSLSTMPAVARN